MFIFPVCVLACYGILCAIEPHKALIAMRTSGNLLLYIALPLVLVFVIMLALNLFVKPAQIVGLFGKRFKDQGHCVFCGGRDHLDGTYLCMVSFVKKSKRGRGGKWSNGDIPLYQGCQTIPSSSNDRLLWVGIRSNTNISYCFCLHRYRMFYERFYEGEMKTSRLTASKFYLIKVALGSD